MMFHRHHLLLLLVRSSTPPCPPPRLPSLVLLKAKWYSQRKDDNHEIGEKARSVAEEFARVAKEKSESVSQSVEDGWEGTLDAVAETVEKGEPEAVKNKYKATAAADKLAREE